MKEFTLIELLAVIVILAIIALIATPIVLNIIEKSKESTKLRSTEYYLNAVELAIARNRLNNIKLEGTYNILSNGNICLESSIKEDGTCVAQDEITIDVKGETPDSGTVKIKQNKVVYLEVVYDGTTIILSKPVSFAKDSWEIIIANIQAGNVAVYKDDVGQDKTITLTSEDDENGNRIPESGIIYNSLEPVVRDVIIDTTVVSGHEFIDIDGDKKADNNVENYTTTDKLYLLSTKEVVGTASNLDEVKNETRQLDYYRSREVTNNNYLETIKKYKYEDKDKAWWLRSAASSTYDNFSDVSSKGYISTCDSGCELGVAPAFRLG